MTTLNQNLSSSARTSNGEVSNPEYWARRKRWSYSEISCHQKCRHPRPSSVHKTNFSSTAPSMFDNTSVAPSIDNIIPSHQNPNGIVSATESCFRIIDHHGIEKFNVKKSIKHENSLRSGSDFDRSESIDSLGIVDKNLSTTTENDPARLEGFKKKGHYAQEMTGMRGIPRNDIRKPRLNEYQTFVSSRTVSDKDPNCNLGISCLQDNIFKIPSFHHVQSDASFNRNISEKSPLSKHVISGMSHTPNSAIEIPPAKIPLECVHYRKTVLKPATWRTQSENNMYTKSKNGVCNFSTPGFAQENSVHQSMVSKENHHNSDEDLKRNQLQLNSCKLATNRENKLSGGFVTPSYKSEYCTIDRQFGLPTPASVNRFIKPGFGQETRMNEPCPKAEVAKTRNLSSVDRLEASQNSVQTVTASPCEADHKQLAAIGQNLDDREHSPVAGLNNMQNCSRVLQNSGDVCSKYTNDREKPKQAEVQLFDVNESEVSNRFGGVSQNRHPSPINKAFKLSSFAKTTERLKSPNGQKSPVSDSVCEEQCSNWTLTLPHGTHSVEVVEHREAAETIAMNDSGNPSKHDKSCMSAETPFITGRSSGTPALLAISSKVSWKNAETLSEHTRKETPMHANLMPKLKVGPSVSNRVLTSATLLPKNPRSGYQVPTSAFLLPQNPGSSYQVPISAALILGNPRSSYQVPTSASKLPGNPGSSYQVPVSESMLLGNSGSSYQVPISAALILGNPRSSYQVPTSASKLPGNPGSSYQVPVSESMLLGNSGSSYQVPTSEFLLPGNPGSSYQVPTSACMILGNLGSSYQVPISAALIPGNPGSSYQVPTSTFLLPHVGKNGFSNHGAFAEELLVRLEQSVIPCTSVISCTSMIPHTSVIPCTSVAPYMSDKGIAPALLRSNKQEAEIGKQLRRTEADIQVLNEIIRDACQRLEAKCQLKHQLLAVRKKMLLERCQDSDDVVVRDQTSGVVPNVSVQEKNAKMSAMSSHFSDQSMTIPLLKALALSNYNRDSSLFELESIHVNSLTTAITEGTEEDLVIKPMEEIGNTQMPNQCSTSGSLGYNTPSICFGIEPPSSSSPYGLICESLTEKKLESLLPVLTSCEPGLRSEKDSFLFKDDSLLSLPERDFISSKIGEEVLLPEKPGTVSVHHKMELCCKSAAWQTPCNFSTSNVDEVVSIASSTTFLQGFSTCVDGYSIPIDFERLDQNKLTVVECVRGSICYNEAPTQVQSLQGVLTKEDKHCSSSATLGSPIQKRRSRKARDKQRCSGGLSMLSSDGSDSEASQARHVLRASSPVLSKKQRRKRRSPVEQLLKDYLHQVSSSDVDIDGLELPQIAKLKAPTL